MAQSIWEKIGLVPQLQPEIFGEKYAMAGPLNNQAVGLPQTPLERESQVTPKTLQALVGRQPQNVSKEPPLPEPASPTLSPLQEMLKERMGGIKGMKEQIENLESQGPSFKNINLSPLLAWADSLGQTNLRAGYTAPVSDAEKIEKLKEAIQKEQGGVADDLLQLQAQEDANKRFDMDQDYKEKLLDLQREKMANALKIAGVKAQNKNRLTPNVILKVNEGNAIPAMLDDVSKVIQGNIDLFDPIKGRANSWNPYNTRIQSVDSQIRAAAQAFGRFMEGGVLRKEDQEKYRKMFPNVGDTPEVASAKLQNVRRQLIQRQNSDLEALQSQGYDTTGLDKDFAIPGLPQSTLGSLAGTAAPGKITVTNGQETFQIDESDLAQAEADGFKRM